MTKTEQSAQIRLWMLKQPRPNTVRVTKIDGEVQDVRIGDSPRWSDVAQTIDALSPASIEAFTESGDLLRAIRLGEEKKVEESADLAKPGLLDPVLHDDPMAALAMHCCDKVANAYEHSTNVAFEHLIALVKSNNERTAQIEKRLERTESAYQAELRFQMKEALKAQEASDPNDEILSTLSKGFQTGFEAQTKPPTNGGWE